jgi:integral membrane protein (TIGR00529 family)
LDFLFDVPVLFRVLVSLGLILVLNRLLRQLSLAVGIGTVLLALWCGHGATDIGRIAWARFSSADNMFLLFVVFQIIWLSSQMSRTGVMKDLVTALRSRLSRRASIAVLPAIVGMLPMPGGAIFSAPLVQDCDSKNELDALLKTKINYWFRHVWEYWWPLYPGVLLAIDLSGLQVWQFVLIQLPMTLLAVTVGYVFLLRKIPGGEEESKAFEHHSVPEILRLVAPVLAVIVVYVAVRVFFPFVTDRNKYLPMILGIFAAIGVHQCQRPLGWSAWREVLCSKKTLNLAVIVAVVRIYGAFIEARLPTGELLVAVMRNELAGWHVPVVSVMMLIPFISGLSTGLAIGFVGASFPIVISLLGENPGMAELVPAVVLAFGFGYMGMILSPVHVCLIVTNEHFSTRLVHSIARLVRPAVTVLIGVLAYYGVLSLILTGN